MYFLPLMGTKIMRLRGIEPPHAAPEATALSTELQTHHIYITIFFSEMQVYFCKFSEIFELLRVTS